MPSLSYWQSDRTPLTVGKRNSVLDAVRKELETKDIKVYVQSILTAYVCKDPPEYESALAMLVDLRSAFWLTRHQNSHVTSR